MSIHDFMENYKRVWVGQDSLADVWRLEQAVKAQAKENAALRERNLQLAAEVPQHQGYEGILGSQRRGRAGDRTRDEGEAGAAVFGVHDGSGDTPGRTRGAGDSSRTPARLDGSSRSMKNFWLKFRKETAGP